MERAEAAGTELRPDGPGPRPAMRTLATATTLVLAAQAAAAQTGPFADGELLVTARDPITLEDTLYRLDPVTGSGAPLFANLFVQYSESGWIAHDPWRDGILAYTSHHPFGPFQPRLFLVRGDGSVASLGFDSATISDLCPVGDGRVYLRIDGVLHRMDATNLVEPVVDAQGTPVELPAEHLTWHAPTNSLIAATASNVAGNPCQVIHAVTALRIPLAADGVTTAGPIACSNFVVGNTVAPVGLDPLPGGDLLLTLADGSLGSDEHLLRLDPFTLALSVWAEPTSDDIDGGVWSSDLGAALIVDDKADALLAVSPGQAGPSTPIATDIPVSFNSTGWGSTNWMTDVDQAQTTCSGLAANFGQGLGGVGGRIPILGAASCPALGLELPLTIDNGFGGATGLLLLGATTATLPALGGTLYVPPPYLLQVPIALDGPNGWAGYGFAEVRLAVPNDAALAGLALYAQAGVFDSGAPDGVALSNGLEIVL